MKEGGCGGGGGGRRRRGVTYRNGDGLRKLEELLATATLLLANSPRTNIKIYILITSVSTYLERGAVRE